MAEPHPDLATLLVPVDRQTKVTSTRSGGFFVVYGEGADHVSRLAWEIGSDPDCAFFDRCRAGLALGLLDNPGKPFFV